MLTENLAGASSPGRLRTCGTHNTGQQPPSRSVGTPWMVCRALWFLESAAVSLLLDLGWQLEPTDPNRSGLIPPAGHWSGLGGER